MIVTRPETYVGCDSPGCRVKCGGSGQGYYRCVVCNLNWCHHCHTVGTNTGAIINILRWADGCCGRHAEVCLPCWVKDGPLVAVLRNISKTLQEKADAERTVKVFEWQLAALTIAFETECRKTTPEMRAQL